MPRTIKTRQRLIYLLLVALVSPLLFLRESDGPRAPVADKPSVRADASVRIGRLAATRVTEHTATLTWETNVPADSQVTYGERSPYERGTRRDRDLTRSHRVVLKNLESGATYQACVVSASADGCIGTADEIAFRTLGVAGFRDESGGEPYSAIRSLPSKTSGVAARDYDNDGDIDLLVCAENYKGSRLFRNDGGTLTDVTRDAGLIESARAGAWADFDGDGDADIALSSGWKLHLFENTGPPSWQFRPANELLPRQPRYSSEGIGWLDYNCDGWPDLLIANGAYGLLLYRNTGSASPRFVDVSTTAGLGRGGVGVGLSDFLSIADLNGDGFADFLYNVRGRSCLLGQNTAAGRFHKAVDSGLDFRSRQRIGFALGDYDNDGDLDLFVPMSTGNALFRNDGKGHFTNAILNAGALRESAKGCSAAWADVDNDGDLDLYVGRWYSPDELYSNNGDGTFRLATKEFRFDQQSGVTAQGVVFMDIDHDGDMDLFVGNRRAGSFLYINQAVFEGQHHYLRVELAPKLQRAGTAVALYTRGGELVGYRQIAGAEGWGCQSPPEAHFGCRPGQYEVRVTLPTKRVVKKLVTTTATGPNVVTIK